MSDELRPQKVPRPTEGRRGDFNPSDVIGEGKPPLRTGAVNLTPRTEENLRAVGWQPGDPIPGNLGEELKKIQIEVLREKAEANLEDSELAAGWEPPKIDFVDIKDLPPEKQEQVRQYLQEYKRDMEQQAREQATMKEMDEQIPENVQGHQRDVMRDAIAQQTAARTQGFIDDRKTPEAKQESKPAEPKEEKSEAVENSDIDLAAITESHCPRCSWPLHMEYDVEVKDFDKHAFLATLLGVENRFKKEYFLMNNNMRLVFRSLTTDETHLIDHQLRHMMRNTQEIVGDGDYWGFLMKFRLVLGLETIEIAGSSVYSSPAYSEWVKQNPPTSDDKTTVTELPRMEKWFEEHTPKPEPIRRVMNQTQARFQRLVEAMEANADNENFWKGIELQR